ncbi:MAG: acyltransferase [Aeromonas sp.]
MLRFFDYFLCIPKSIIVNLYLCPRNFFRLPILVSHNTKLKNLSGRVYFECDKVNMGMFRIGFGRIEHMDGGDSRTILSCAGNITVKGKVKIGQGSKLVVCKNGMVVFGENFKISSSSKIICEEKIEFGSGVLISWDVLIMDSDQHSIFYAKNLAPLTKPILIDDNVWIGCRTYVGKGSRIPSEVIIGAGSVVCKSFDTTNVVIAGNPAVIVKRNISWKE